MKKKPIKEFRKGLIVVRIWQKRSRRKSGFSTSVSRLYRNGDTWKESTRFDRDDIPLIQLVLSDAHKWLLLQLEK